MEGENSGEHVGSADMEEFSTPSSLSSSSSSPSASPPHSHYSERLTVTQREQMRVEQMVSEIYQVLHDVSPNARSLMLELWRDKHIEFLTRGLKQLGPSYHVLDANRPWLCYWILHSVALLGDLVDPELEDNLVDFLTRCEDNDGGYGGGPGQMPHLATTYAAINTLVSLRSEKALLSIKRDKMYNFLLRMKDSSGSFRMHDGGEVDVRACYTAISVASILNILDDQLVDNVGNFILRCQTYEGGIGAEPGSEAHGGYTFCGLAAMILINEAERVDLPSLIDWVAFRQGVECGFQGRTNKLVDGCYSFWQGGALALTQRLLMIVDKQYKSSFPIGGSGPLLEQLSLESACSSTTSDLDGHKSRPDKIVCLPAATSSDSKGKLSDTGFTFIKQHTECGPLFHNIALQQYILLCSQILDGGFKDKPGKYRDHYHSCYCLSGLSVSQYSCTKDADVPPLPSSILGAYSNLLEPIHPLYNVVLDRYYNAHEFFSIS